LPCDAQAGTRRAITHVARGPTEWVTRPDLADHPGQTFRISKQEAGGGFAAPPAGSRVERASEETVAQATTEVSLLAASKLFELAGSVYPVPAGVYAWLPYVFVALLASGLGWFLVLRVRFPERLRELEAELLTK